MGITPPPSGPSARIELAVEEAAVARQAGRYREAIERTAAAGALLGSGPVRRELRVALAREAGLGWIGLDRPREAHDQLMLALERAGGEPALVDPVRGALAELELMRGDAREARRWLADRGRDRRATLLAQARLELYEGDVAVAEQALQGCEQAPGGVSGVAPPSTALRSLAALWEGRPDQARMLLDGVASAGNPHWELVRLLVLRASWVHSGDARHLQLALGRVEELRFGAPAGPRPAGFAALVASQHALLLTLVGETALALDAAHAAEAQLAALSLPEWPLQAVLHDLGVVYRDADLLDRWQAVAERYAELAPGPWPARVRLVVGPRADDALAPRAHGGPGGTAPGGPLGAMALDVLEEAADPPTALLTSLVQAVGAHGGTWTSPDGRAVARVGTALVPSDAVAAPVVLELGPAGAIALVGASSAATARLDVVGLERLARAARSRLTERRSARALGDAVQLAEAGRRAAEEALERLRRPGTAAVVGGSYPSVAGRSERLRAALDRLAVLSAMGGPILLEGPVGSGRRHLARAAQGRGLDEGPGSLPVLDVALVPAEAQPGALARLVAAAHGGPWLVANAEHLGPEGAAWLLAAVSGDHPHGPARVTLDADAEGAAAVALRQALAPVRIAVPGVDERVEDLPSLIDALAREAGRRPEEIGTAARALLARRSWPGHVAELRAAILAAAARADKATLLPEHFEAGDEAATVPLSESLGLGYHDAVRSFRRDLLGHALEVAGGNRTRAAELLGLQRTYFMRLIRELGEDAEP